MGGERGTYGAQERCIQGFGGETEGKRQLWRPRRNGFILTWIFDIGWEPVLDGSDSGQGYDVNCCEHRSEPSSSV